MIEFIEEIVRYKTDTYRLKFVKAIRTRGRLVANQQTDEFIQKLSLAIETHGSSADKGPYKAAAAPAQSAPPTDSSAVDEFDTLYRKHFKKRSFGSTLPQRPEILDELTLLLEQVRAHNRESAPQGEPPAAAPPAEAVSVV